jgi:hypothetical protein
MVGAFSSHLVSCPFESLGSLEYKALGFTIGNKEVSYSSRSLLYLWPSFEICSTNVDLRFPNTCRMGNSKIESHISRLMIRPNWSALDLKKNCSTPPLFGLLSPLGKCFGHSPLLFRCVSIHLQGRIVVRSKYASHPSKSNILSPPIGLWLACANWVPLDSIGSFKVKFNVE